MNTFSQDVILDERGSVTVGKKLLEAKRVGYPYIVVFGKRSVEPVPVVELHDLHQNTQHFFTVAQLLDYLKQFGK